MNAGAVIRGRRNRAAGAEFERIIENSCRVYSAAGIAEIEKTPEPMKLLGGANKNGRFLACFTKKAQPDFKGTLKGGKSIVFEAKYTDTGRIQQSAVLEQQSAALERHSRLGAECFILVAFGFKSFFKIPWRAWRDMKELYGRKYLTPADIQEYTIKTNRGLLNFLSG